MSQAQTATVATLIRKPVSAADFKQNAEVLHAAVVKATDAYNAAVLEYNRAVELENITSGIQITFNEGKGEKVATLSGQVITRLDNGTYQVLVQFVGGPAKLSVVKPADVVAIHAPLAEPVVEEVSMPAETPEFDAQ